MSGLTVEDLHTVSRRAIGKKLEEIYLPAAVSRSGDLIDLLIWNVVIAFAVGVSSNAAFAFFAEKLRKNGRVNSSDIHLHMHTIVEIRLNIQNHSGGNASNVIGTVLRSFIRGGDERQVVAQEIAKLLEEIVK